MGCEQQPYNQTGFYGNVGCTDCGSSLPQGCTPFDASCGIYNGPALTCIGATAGITIEQLFQLIDSKVCETTGDYSTYNLACLSPVTTEQEFVESISQYVCDNKDDFDTFVGTTYVAGIQALEDQITELNDPDITSPCSNIVIPANSSIAAVLQILANTGCSLYSAINPSTANWNQCFTVVTPPTTIVGAFNIVLDQICQVKASTGSTTLPTFNNVGSCLPSPSATDSLVATITKMKTRLCQTPTFAAGNLTSSACISFTGSSTLEQVINAQNGYLTIVGQSAIRAASSDFTIDYIDPLQPCLGSTISLNTSVVDRKVASTSSDLTPGTLQDKLQAGTNVSFDYITTPGKVIINATGGAVADEKVKINSSDPTPGYLLDKLAGDNSTDPFITTLVTALSATQAKVTGTLNLQALAAAILELIADDVDLKASFCALAASCPVVCEPPTNVSVTFQ